MSRTTGSEKGRKISSRKNIIKCREILTTEKPSFKIVMCTQLSRNCTLQSGRPGSAARLCICLTQGTHCDYGQATYIQLPHGSNDAISYLIFLVSVYLIIHTLIPQIKFKTVFKDTQAKLPFSESRSGREQTEAPEIRLIQKGTSRFLLWL